MLYLEVFGVASCLSSRLFAKVKSCNEYVLLFNEGPYKKLQEKPLDVLSRFWIVIQLHLDIFILTF